MLINAQLVRLLDTNRGKNLRVFWSRFIGFFYHLYGIEIEIRFVIYLVLLDTLQVFCGRGRCHSIRHAQPIWAWMICYHATL